MKWGCYANHQVNFCIMAGSYWGDFFAAVLGLYLFHSALVGRFETHRRGGGHSIIIALRSSWIRIALALSGVAICVWVGLDLRQKLGQ